MTRPTPGQFELATREKGPGCRPIPKDHPSAAMTTHLKTVNGEIISGMGIHKSPSGDWVLTDLYTGCRMISTKTRKDARRLAHSLAHLYSETGQWLDEQAALAEIGAHTRAYMEGLWLDRTPSTLPGEKI